MTQKKARLVDISEGQYPETVSARVRSETYVWLEREVYRRSEPGERVSKGDVIREALRVLMDDVDD